MRQSIFVCLSLLFSLVLWGKEQEKATQITGVKVFRSGAQITRTATASVPGGSSTLIFTGLSKEVNQSSVQVSGLGKFTILSVKTRKNYLQEKIDKGQVKTLKDRLKAIKKELQDIDAIVEALQIELEMLKQNMQVGGEQNGVDITVLREAAQFIGSRTKAINLELLEYRRKETKLNEEATDLTRQINELQAVKGKTTSEIVVQVEAPQPVEAQFSISYLVSAAGWSPLYDIRVPDVTSPVSLTYKAQIFQSTGIDWEGINLTLSSGDPTASTQMPELQPWYLTLDRPTYPLYKEPQRAPVAGITEVSGIVRDATTGEPVPMVNVMVKDVNGQTLNGGRTNLDGYYTIAVPPGGIKLEVTMIGYTPFTSNIYANNITALLTPDKAQLNEVEIQAAGSRASNISYGISGMDISSAANTVANTTSQRATTFEFAIEVPYDIPSDGQYHTVGIKEIELPATYTYYATPKLDLDAFLFAKVTGWEDAQLLNGTANLFFENTNVGETYLDIQQVSDTIDLSLGRDQDIIITRTKRKDYTTKQFIGNKKTATITWDLEVRNNKSHAIRLKLYDQIPVSRQEEIEVTLEEYNGSPKYNEDKGFLTWVMALPANAQEKVFFKYSVKYPKNRRLFLE